MKERIKKLYSYVMIWYSRVLKAKNTFHINFFTRIRYAFRGFTAKEYVWYNLKENNYKEYISDFERILSRKINGEYKIILDNKLLFEEIFRNYTRVPETYGWISDGNIYSIHNSGINNNNVIEFIKEKKELVLKWEKGYEGKGTYIIEYKDNCYFINNEKVSLSELKKYFDFKGNAIISEYMHQSKFESNLYNKSANTIRIVCAKKKHEKEMRIIKAYQRIGNEYSKPVDNFSAGGFSVEINIKTGELGVAIAGYGPDDRRMKKFSIHPDSNAKIKGEKIPNWNDIVMYILDISNQFPYMNFIAWDLLITDREEICLIEGNASSGCDIFQMEHGVRNDELGEIYRSYNIIR